jgi:phosphoenolpyruvate phosphomutase
MSLNSLMAVKRPVRAAGAHSGLGAALVEAAGLDAVWASSFEISAAHCLPDASLLTMRDYLEATSQMQKACTLPIIADVDTGFGGTMNVAYMVREYEREGVAAVCIEDKIFPKMNSFVATSHTLLSTDEFCRKIEVAKSVQSRPDFHVIARTEALINGHGVGEALDRCERYADAGADSVLVHSKEKSKEVILSFLKQWDGRVPVVIVPTTYPDWHAAEAAGAGVAMVIYANQGLRAMIQSMLSVFSTIREDGHSSAVEGHIASVRDVFRLQHLEEWQEMAG